MNKVLSGKHEKPMNEINMVFVRKPKNVNKYA
jgi:hypothetical protein